MDTSTERDGTGALAGHDAVASLQSLIRSIDQLLDESAGNANAELARYCGRLARDLVPPVHAIADELRRQHGDVPALRQAIIRVEQRLRDRPAAEK